MFKLELGGWTAIIYPPFEQIHPIAAVGGVVCPATPTGTEVALICRSDHHGWSLPQGKPAPGEDPPAAACREVAAQTGASTILGRRLPFHLRRVGRDSQLVACWAMRRRATGAFSPNKADAVVWLPVAQARTRLSDPGDLQALDALSDRWDASRVLLICPTDAGPLLGRSPKDTRAHLDGSGKSKPTR